MKRIYRNRYASRPDEPTFAHASRMQSDAETYDMTSNTSCWDCSAVYPMTFKKCPACGATNANDDFKAAIREIDFINASAKLEGGE